MEIGRHIDALERAGLDLVDAAEKAGLDAPVPTCPEWTVRELVQHVGYVHRWAATYVRECRTTPLTDEEEERAVGPMPSDADLITWFQAGHTDLVDLLRAAPPTLSCWHFLPADSPLAFWARRQAHETTIHRADLQGAIGDMAGVDADVSIDGIDELLMGFYANRGGRLRCDTPCTLTAHVIDGARADGPRSWTVRMGPAGVTITRGTPDAPAGPSPAGPASPPTAPVPSTTASSVAPSAAARSAPAASAAASPTGSTAASPAAFPAGATTASAASPAAGSSASSAGTCKTGGAPGGVHCTLRGSASDLYLALWNRRPTTDLHTEGDESVLALWREKATIRWT